MIEERLAQIALLADEINIIEPYMVFIWLGIFILMIILELLTTDLISIWFAGGALITIFLSLIPGMPFWAELIVFAVISLALILAIRPIAKKYLMKGKDSKFNADSMIGMKVKVTKTITELERGEITLHGVIWTAEADEGLPINEEEIVEIIALDGNKVKVRRIETEEEGNE